MYTPQTLARDVRVQLAAAIIVFLVAATVPYMWLIEHFGYDDILREPAADILTKFHAGGDPLVFAWFGFAMSALLFIPVAIGFRKLLATHGQQNDSALVLGVSSAIAQTIGLLRWVLVVPAMATTFTDPRTFTTTREALLVAFDTVHHYGGMVIGEMTGQLLLAGWTGMVATALWRTRAVPRFISVLGLLTLPFWLLGQTELLHQVMPSIPSIEVIPLAFTGWEVWLLAVCVALIISIFKMPSLQKG